MSLITLRKDANPFHKLYWSRLIALLSIAVLMAAALNAPFVAQASPAPSFTLSASPSSFTLLVGENAWNRPVLIRAVNPANLLWGKVSFNASGVPVGVTATIATVDATSSNLTFKAGSATLPGSFSVTVTGTSGTTTSSTTVQLTIPSPSFSLSSSASNLTLLVGGASATSGINVTGQNGFASSVDLAVSGLPVGVTAVFSPASTAFNKSTLTLTPGNTAVPGTYAVTVTGTSGSLKSSTPIALTIPKPGFSISTSASTLGIFVGGNSANSTIGVLSPIGLTNSCVNLVVSGVPAGVTASLNWPVSCPTSPVTLTLKPSAGALPGTYKVNVTGTSGVATNTGVITLVVTAPSFSLSPSASSFTLLAGQNSWNLPINIAAVNQVGILSQVSLTASGVPAGVTTTFATVDANTTALTFKASPAAIAGKYPLTVTGTSGVASSSVTIMLSVQGAGFTLSSSASSLTLVSGGASASSTISVIGQSGFAGTVNLAATGVPNGVSTSFGSASTTNTSSLTFSPSSAAVPGAYNVIVTGTSGGMTSTTTLTLTVQGAVFSLSSSPGALTLVAGGAGASSTIGVSGGSGFNSVVSLAVSGVPAGVSASLSSSSASPTTPSSFTFAASNTAVAGTYTLTVTGTFGAVTSASNIVLTVQAAAKSLPTSIAITQPTYGFNVLPGSVRRIFATVTGGTTNAVSWSATGGATLSATSGNWVDVTAPAAGSQCSIDGTGPYTIGSAAQFMVTAKSMENASLTSSITVKICNPAIQVNVVPFYTTLYSGQMADIQAFVWGSANRNVTWAITSQPNGGDGVLADTANQDTVFWANTAGRYTLTATSAADGSKANTATIYVTGHYAPYQVTPSETLPVDCTVDPGLTGTTYDVGPSQPYKTIQSVPWTSLKAGSTVRIHNEDTSGGNPTTYHEYFQVTSHAMRTQPVRVCGVPDSRGNLPVIDASNSTGRSDVSNYSAGYGAVVIGSTGWAGLYTGTWNGPQNLIVEGLKIQNAKPPSTYTTPGGVAGTAWVHGAACLRIYMSMDTVVRGIDAFNCSNGLFADFNANNGYFLVANTLYEGNHVHGNGESGSYSYHQFYIQGWNEVAQFNIIDQYQSGAAGSNFKGRGFPEVIRYNHFGDGAARQIDLIDNQDAGAYTSFEGYLGGSTSYHAIYPADAYSADLLAAAVEAHHADYVYGNTFLNISAGVPIHYFSDTGAADNNRLGTLWFYNNSFYEPSNSYWRWFMFDTSGGGAGDDPAIEWPQIQVHNNAIWLDSPAKPYFYWNKESNQFTNFGKNVITSNWGNGVMTGGDGTGWANSTSPYTFQGATNTADTTGVSNLIGVSADPFDVSTFSPYPALINAGANLPAFGPRLPVRFQYGPSAIQKARIQPLTVGAME